VAVVFLYKITVFLQQNTTASLLELYFHDPMQTVYARGGGGGSQQREVTDGADAVFADTGAERPSIMGATSKKPGRNDRVWGGHGADRPRADRIWGGSTGTHPEGNYKMRSAKMRNRATYKVRNKMRT